MEEEKARYLDEERVKLWQELRGTQERLKSIEYALSGDVEAERRGLATLALKVGRAYGRIKTRDDASEKYLASISEHKAQIETISKTIVDLKLKVDAIHTDLTSKNDEIAKALNGNQDIVESYNNKLEELKVTFGECQQKLSELSNAEQEAQAKVDKLTEKCDYASEEAEQIENLHNLLYGYEKEDGTQVEGRKKKLENVYGDLTQKAEALQANMERFEEENQQACNSAVNKAKEELSAVKEKLENLLPDALTAGLSSAYEKNREMEQREQTKSFATFVLCIICMILLAIVPAGINFWLWWHDKREILEILMKLPREMLCVLPLYIPLLWLAFFANKRANLSKRLIEEYKHKEAVSKTYEGLSKQISALTDEKISRELQARLLYNTVMLSEKNPGELIKNYNRPDNPLLDVLNSGYELSESLNKLAAFPGMERIIKAINERKVKADEIVGEAIDASHE